MKILSLLLLICCLLGYFQRNSFSADVSLNPLLLQEPLQSKIALPRQFVNFADQQYYIDRQYRYELYGLVVSYREHDGDQMLHKRWGDHLNIADLCVVWSHTAKSPYLNQIDFWNGQFTCNVKTSSQQAWQSVNMTQLSNNHLLSADQYLRDKISNVRIGDQILIKGWLAEYGHEQGKIRGSSITRDDQGNGACETIFVEQFEILQAANNPWRKLFYVSLSLLLGLLLWYLFSPFKVNSKT